MTSESTKNIIKTAKIHLNAKGGLRGLNELNALNEPNEPKESNEPSALNVMIETSVMRDLRGKIDTVMIGEGIITEGEIGTTIMIEGIITAEETTGLLKKRILISKKEDKSSLFARQTLKKHRKCRMSLKRLLFWTKNKNSSKKLNKNSKRLVNIFIYRKVNGGSKEIGSHYPCLLFTSKSKGERYLEFFQ
jgi:hypothetical protein